MRLSANFLSALLATGAVWLVPSPSQATQLLYAFSDQPGNTGDETKSALITDATGALYGTTTNGGPNGNSYGDGVAYKLTPPPPGQVAWTQTVLYAFGASRHDGINPLGGLVMAATGGVLYGVTEFGGANGVGTVYALVPPSRTGTGWSERILYSFQSMDGIYPNSRLVIDGAGNLYGTLNQGGIFNSTCQSGCGVLFKLAPPQAGQSSWTHTTLYQFTGSADGSYASSALIIDPAGNLYGEATGGVTRDGVVYQLAPPQAGQPSWAQTILHNFAGPPADGTQGSGLVINAAGVLFGSTVFGGNQAGPPMACFQGCGIAFSLTPPLQPSTAWTETVLHDFTGGVEQGYIPVVDAISSSGALLGRSNGGASCPAGGTVGLAFQLSPPASGQATWTEQPIFGASCAYGANENPLLPSPNGTVTAATTTYGPLGGGTVFRFTVH